MTTSDDAGPIPVQLAELDAWLDACEAELERRRYREQFRDETCRRLDRVRTLRELAQQSASADLDDTLQSLERNLEAYLHSLQVENRALPAVPPALSQRDALPAQPGAEHRAPLELAADWAEPQLAAEDLAEFSEALEIGDGLDLALLAATASTDDADDVTAEKAAVAERLRVTLEGLLTELTDPDLKTPAAGDGCIEARRSCTYRAAICRAAGAAAEAEASRVSGRVQQLVTDIRNSLQFDSDEAEHFPFDDRYWEAGPSRSSPAWWQQTAAAYTALPDAHAAMRWYRENASLFAQSPPSDLLEAIGARQQILFRLLSNTNGKDRYQRQVYDWLLDTINETNCYLFTLSPNTTDSELVEKSATLDQQLTAAHAAAAAAFKSDSEQRILREVTGMIAEPGFAKGRRKGEDADRLRASLEEWLKCKLPVTHKGIRSLLIALPESFLVGADIPPRFMSAVREEKARQARLTAKVQAPDDDAASKGARSLTDRELEELRLWLDRRRVLILGGTPKSAVTKQLKEALGEDLIEWKGTAKNSTAAQFESSIKRAYVLIVIIKFAGHDFSEKGKEWVGRGSGVFLQAQTYSAQSLLRLLHNQANGIAPKVPLLGK
ncbi:MAG: hypothetical protein KGJ62_01305 [Armatimonadetes bacterium]|nr:hypothetical protein [Armatimonadota bacterium]MDE2205858.1 hypothetical protein [Armatimonadota bacterium]